MITKWRVLSTITALLCVVACVPRATADNLPLPKGEARTPDTRALTADEAAQVLERDWLFQAMGEPLVQRAAKEIGWARELAERLARQRQAPDLTNKLKELDALQRRLGELASQPTTVQSAKDAEAVPNWIWYPEGNPVEDAPAEARYLRCRFRVPAEIREATLRIGVDNACEVFLNGTKIGAQTGWAPVGVFPVGQLLRTGENVLAVRAENMPAPTKNPAGLIARLAVTLADGKQTIVVSDTSWSAAKEEHSHWTQADFDDSAWKPAAVTAPFGGGPWGKIAGLDKASLQEDPLAAYADTAPAVKELYFTVRRVKREILFKNSVLDFTRLLFIDQPLPQGPESRHEAIHRMGIMAAPGGDCWCSTGCIRAANSGNWRPKKHRAASGDPICRSMPKGYSSASSRTKRKAFTCTK